MRISFLNLAKLQLKMYPQRCHILNLESVCKHSQTKKCFDKLGVAADVTT